MKSVVAVDVSPTIATSDSPPGNFELVLSDGASVPVAAGSIDVAFSDQLTEYSHPDDARRQLKEVFEALTPGGMYNCITPNRLSGPHDVSGNFDSEPKGLHLKEYDQRSSIRLFRENCFRRIRRYIGGGDLFFRTPVLVVCVAEAVIERLPRSVRGLAASRALLGVNVVATNIGDGRSAAEISMRRTR